MRTNPCFPAKLDERIGLLTINDTATCSISLLILQAAPRFLLMPKQAPGWADNPFVYKESQFRESFERVVGMHKSMFRSNAFVREHEAALPASLIICRVKEAPLLNS